ncbi:S1 RNA-binding domain-containing protein, partial [candidate division GN15 bacterium]|nr:S1 RNA-binding domain-containing protein [candidate division GN15 bacterium]
MAEAKKTTKKKVAAKTSKRKATSGRKTTKTKTKLTTKTVEEVAQKAPNEVHEESQERVMTARRQRMLEKAKAREVQVPSHETPPEVASMKITDVSGVVYDKADYEAMVDMYDSTIRDIKEGEIVHGTVIGVNPEDVIVDVGFKSEGLINIHEFPQPLNISVGDEIDVYLEQMEDANGQLLLSKQKADFMKVWDKIREVHDAGDTIEGRIARRIKG